MRSSRRSRSRARLVIVLQSRVCASAPAGAKWLELSAGQQTTAAATTKMATSLANHCFQYIKILIPHVLLVSVLIGYLCLGAWMLMMLETRTELVARFFVLSRAVQRVDGVQAQILRSRKLIRLTNAMSNFTADSWQIINDAQTGVRSIHHTEWEQIFRCVGANKFCVLRGCRETKRARFFFFCSEYMLRVSETVDDRRPIRRELNRPDDLDNLHNKWTFPTSLVSRNLHIRSHLNGLRVCRRKMLTTQKFSALCSHRFNNLR